MGFEALKALPRDSYLVRQGAEYETEEPKFLP